MQQTISNHNDLYFDEVLKCIPRMLSLQNRNPISSTYGSFHRSHWLHRIFDFPSAIYQMSCHTLAHLYDFNNVRNPYFQNENILEWSIAGFKYALNLQKNDGSFDEWYPNERGWAGPTGYLMHALIQTYLRIEKYLSPAEKQDFKKRAQKAAKHLIKHEELDILANHYGIALLPLYEIYQLTEDKEILAGYENCFKNFESYWNQNEGWFLEYDGADIGYLAATISFLARLHSVTKDRRIEKMVEKAIQFSSYFCYPDFTFGGAVGSRQTAMFYPYGYEYWGQIFPLAKTIANWGREGLSEGHMIIPNQQGDHYLNYRIQEYLEATELKTYESNENFRLPFNSNEDFQNHFHAAKILVKKFQDKYIVINYGKGGVVKYFDLTTNKCILNDSGFLIQTSKGEKLTNQWIDPKFKIQFKDDIIQINGKCIRLKDQAFTPLTWIMFRVFMLFTGWNSSLSKLSKKFIRKLIVIGINRSDVSFERIITLKSKLKIKDTIHAKQSKIVSFFSGSEFFIRYVPQSCYFTPPHLNSKTYKLNSSQLNNLYHNSKYVIEREF